jgi:hypothetical protein
MQDDHRDAMEDNEWVHEGSGRCCKVNACTSFNVAKCLFHTHLDQHMAFRCNWVDLDVHLFIMGVLSNKTTLL